VPHESLRRPAGYAVAPALESHAAPTSLAICQPKRARRRLSLGIHTQGVAVARSAFAIISRSPRIAT